MLSQTNFEQSLPEALHNQARLVVKGDYTFNFLELDDAYSVRQLEQIAKLLEGV